MHQTLPHAGAIHLRELFPSAQFFAGRDVKFTSCSSDAKACRPGDLFIAMELPDSDGHAQAFQAVARGAVGVLAERILPVGVPVCVVDDTREAYGRVCQELLGHPAKTMQLFGITGTSGKTTTAMLLRSILHAAEQMTGTMSTLGYDDGFETGTASQTTPNPPQMAKWLARMSANGCTSAVIEASSQGLAQRRLAGLELDGAIITNIKRDHIDFHNSVEGYRKAKARLLKHLKPDGFAIVNADDPTSLELLAKIDHPTLTYGVRSPADVTATIVERYRSEQTFLLCAGNDTIPVRTRMIGNHHVSNCLAAAAAGLVLGIDLPTIVRGLEQVERIPGRLERIECGQPFGVFVDDAHTPDALKSTLRALKQVTDGKLFCVYGADSDRDPAMRPLLGHVVEREADVSVITSDNPRADEPLQIAHDILDGYDKPGAPHVMSDRCKAIHWALEQAGAGDTVVIAGKGDRQLQIIDDMKIHFDDCEVAREWLYQVGANNDYDTGAGSSGLKIFNPQ